jgi:hypothetical protein
MIRVNIKDDAFNRAYWNARRTLPVERLETPRQYGIRWRETFKCRVDSNSSNGPGNITYIFDCDEDYTWFMLKYS